MFEGHRSKDRSLRLPVTYPNAINDPRTKVLLDQFGIAETCAVASAGKQGPGRDDDTQSHDPGLANFTAY